MRQHTRFFGNDGTEQPVALAVGAVRETFDDAGMLVKRESFRANCEATAAMFREMELANLGTTEGAIKGWESRRAGAQGTITEDKASELAPRVEGKQHGFTYYPAKNEHATSGYVVAYAEIPKQYEQRISLDTWHTNRVALLKAYADQHKEILAKDPKARLGAWYDDNKEPPEICLDVSQQLPTREGAMAEARRLHEDGIYDVVNKKYIPTEWPDKKQ